jgi:hypothetical protein
MKRKLIVYGFMALCVALAFLLPAVVRAVKLGNGKLEKVVTEKSSLNSQEVTALSIAWNPSLNYRMIYTIRKTYYRSGIFTACRRDTLKRELEIKQPTN